MLAVGILERAFYFPSYFPSLILTLFHWRGWFLCLYVQTFKCRVRHRHNNMTTFPRFLYFSIYSPHSVTLNGVPFSLSFSRSPSRRHTLSILTISWYQWFSFSLPFCPVSTHLEGLWLACKWDDLFSMSLCPEWMQGYDIYLVIWIGVHRARRMCERKTREEQTISHIIILRTILLSM